MSYCEHCGEKNFPHATVCENCGTPLPVEERERLQPGYGYDIHSTNCRHRLKIEPMHPIEKLYLLDRKKFLFMENLLLIAGLSLLLLGNIFRISNPLFQDVMETKAGIFGPKGDFFAGIYCILSLTSLLIAANPLFTRNTYCLSQLLPAMILEVAALCLVIIPLTADLYFGTYMGTSLAPGGYLLMGVCILALVIQCILAKEYQVLRKSGVYSYVAN